MKNVLLIVLIFGIPASYILFRDELISEWNNIEATIAVLSYYTSLLFYAYLTNMKFHFVITRIINIFKYDHTTWKFSAKLITDKSIKDCISLIGNKFTKDLNKIRSKTDTSIEVLVDNDFLVSVSAQILGGENQIFVRTSKITVPMRETKKRAVQITKLIESIESAIIPNSSPEKEYEIDIEYNGKSPYYSYWVKKLPEEIIYNFNLSLNIPNAKDSKVRVNKNHLTISSKSYAMVFDLTRDYALLKSPT